MRSPVSVVLCSFLILATAWAAHGAITFQFNYTDTDSGFNDPTAGPARRAALEQAAQIFGNSALAGYNATIVMDASGTAPPFAAAGSNDLLSDDFPGGGFGRIETVRNKILSNGATDLNGPDSDGSVSWNFDQTMWELDINTTAAGGNFDFYSTVYHELVHALGWLDTADAATGADSFGGGLSGGDPGEWNMYDQFLSDRTGTRFINGTTFINDDPEGFTREAVGGTSAGFAGGLFFAGPNAVAANGGSPVGLYTPEEFEEGSSIGHLDDENPALAGLMLLAAPAPGPSARTFSDIEIGMLQDLGYTMIQQISPQFVSGAFDAAGFQAVISPGSVVAIGGFFTDATAVASSVPLSISENDLSFSFRVPNGKLNHEFGAVFGVFDGAFDQANVQVPWDLDVSSGKVEVRVHRAENGAKQAFTSPPYEVNAAPASPGIFTFDFGPGRAIVQNLDGSFAHPVGTFGGAPPAAPAPIGGVIIIWSNGLGPVPMPPVTGDVPGFDEGGNAILPVPTKIVRVFIDGQLAQSFPVLHPTLVGVNQVNAVVPGGGDPWRHRFHRD